MKLDEAPHRTSSLPLSADSSYNDLPMNPLVARWGALMVAALLAPLQDPAGSWLERFVFAKNEAARLKVLDAASDAVRGRHRRVNVGEALGPPETENGPCQP